MSDAPLVALVDKEEADEAIESLKREGCYDADRRIRQADETALALPITDPPTTTPVRSVVSDASPDYRVRDLDDMLANRGFTAEERRHAPSSWAIIGTVLLARFEDCPREQAIGEAMLELHRGVDTILAREGIAGAHREPSVRVVAGEGDTETIHREHGTAYAMDLSVVMFSPGNKAERVRMGEVVTRDEQVFDMFAGIGYFTLPMAHAGAEVTATERNPAAFRYLLENAELNEVSDHIHAYRADCRAVDSQADRVVMGYYDAADYLDAGIAALRSGGTIHLHDVAPIDDPYADAIGAIEAADGRCTIDNRRVIKSHSPGMAHVVIDAVRSN